MRLCLLALFLTITAVLGGRSGGGGGRHGGTHVHTSHSYPHSTGYSGTGTGGAHTYPHSNGMSGNSYTHNNYQQNSARYNTGMKSEVHHHYHYSPPQQITYGSTYHPVYHGTPPVYVYQYRDSGSRFDNLLTGLALYNLGRMSANSHHYNYDSHRDYSGSPGEICKLGISKRTGEYEETRIDCKLMSSFIFDAGAARSQQATVVTSNSSITTTTNVTINGNGGANGNTSVITSVTVKNETVTDALKVKGPSIEVTPGMTCYMIRISRDTSVLKKNVECGLLQEYALRSMRHNGAERWKPTVTIFLLLLYIVFI